MERHAHLEEDAIRVERRIEVQHRTRCLLREALPLDHKLVRVSTEDLYVGRVDAGVFENGGDLTSGLQRGGSKGNPAIARIGSEDNEGSRQRGDVLTFVVLCLAGSAEAIGGGGHYQ